MCLQRRSAVSQEASCETQYSVADQVHGAHSLSALQEGKRELAALQEERGSAVISGKSMCTRDMTIFCKCVAHISGFAVCAETPRAAAAITFFMGRTEGAVGHFCDDEWLY